MPRFLYVGDADEQGYVARKNIASVKVYENGGIGLYVKGRGLVPVAERLREYVRNELRLDFYKEQVLEEIENAETVKELMDAIKCNWGDWEFIASVLSGIDMSVREFPPDLATIQMQNSLIDNYRLVYGYLREPHTPPGLHWHIKRGSDDFLCPINKGANAVRFETPRGKLYGLFEGV